MKAIGVEELYGELGDVSCARPLFQGDVFRDVILPGFRGGPTAVQIIEHPCSMRRGSTLGERVTVAPVIPLHGKVDWGGNYKKMLLPDLINKTAYAAEFTRVSSIPSGELAAEKRIACLSDAGIYVLQQRLVKHYTRLDVEVEVLRAVSFAVLQEANLQQEWVEAVVPDELNCNSDAISVAAEQFQEWLNTPTADDSDVTYRDLLSREDLYTKVGRDARKAMLQQRQG